MQFQVRDRVFHPIHGIGEIAAVSKQQFASGAARLYYQVVTDKCTVWVPVDAQESIGLRRMVEKRDLDQYRHVLTKRPNALIDDHAKRHAALSERLKQHSFRVLCEVVRDLSARSRHKSLTQLDAGLLRKSIDELYQEWAAAEGISVMAASQEVDALLLQSQQKST